jgi:hypothetical protein
MIDDHLQDFSFLSPCRLRFANGTDSSTDSLTPISIILVYLYSAEGSSSLTSRQPNPITLLASSGPFV